MAKSDRYDFAGIERKWQQRWQEARLFHAEIDPTRPKYYGLDFFPYPSGAGLSVGHIKNYAPPDAFLRYQAMRGYKVLHPMGWDAFGQPAENEALRLRRHPRPMVEEFAANYRRQLELVGLAYDWEREINSSDPEYYRWTQWLFLVLHRMGLAYRAQAPVNWCPRDATVLANEEVVAGRCWRCDTPIEQRRMPQWFFRITAYADRLLDDLDGLAWPEGIKAMQRNWIGRSEGAEIDFPIAEGEASLRVYTTRPDTLWGATFMVVAPEHPLLASLTTTGRRAEVEAYAARAARRGEIDRLAEGREKTGVWTGGYAVNPATNERIPVWVADYVVMGYGGGAIMAVPAHDERDAAFAKAHNLPVVPVYRDGIAVAGPFAGELEDATTVRTVINWLEERGLGRGTVQYKLRDWLISRQRYWGAPIPIVHCACCGEVPVPAEKLPVLLPDVEHYEPSGTGASPLAAISSFVETTCPACGGPARRETDTMGGFACSSWYFLRFADPHNAEQAFSREAVDYWLPVDLYVGGAEHAVTHLLYARFWTKALHDVGLLGFTEPFVQLHCQGMLLAHTPGRPIQAEDDGDGNLIEDWKVLRPEERAAIPEEQWIWRWVKMSKSYGNVVTPDEVVDRHGADALRVYEMFAAPFEETVRWNDAALRGAARFLARVWRLVTEQAGGFNPEGWRAGIAEVQGNALALRRLTYLTIARVTDDLESFRFNTAVAALMEWVNGMYALASSLAEGERSAALDEAIEHLVILLAPFAPHLADELWERLGQQGFLYRHPWPTSDPVVTGAAEIIVVVQLNGKVRDRLSVPAEAGEDELRAAALASEKIRAMLADRAPANIIVVPGKLVNIVTE